MSSNPRNGTALVLVFLILWLGALTFLAVTPVGRELTRQTAGAEQSTRQVLCADALERRQAAEEVLISTPRSPEMYSLWKKALVAAQAQLDQANEDKGLYCR